ncbi:MAG: tRNA-dihydrouridine synthase [Candidatus Saccharimonadales bacterium]
MTFWDELPRPFFALAPMEAVTDVVFRHVIARAAPPDLYYTEFTNATGWVHAGDKAIRGRLVRTDDEHPILAQIWGGEPGDMEQIAYHCRSLGYDGIDINMGCPAKSAVKSGGSALIRRPDIAVASIQAAKSAGLPVSVKTRLGYSSTDEWHNWLRLLLQQDIAALTIHLRTKREMSKVPAHWELMSDIIALRDEVAPQTVVIGNGDVRDHMHGLELIEQNGCDGVMIGRGIFSNPFAFARSEGRGKKDKGRGESLGGNRKSELIDLLKYHLELYDRYAAQTGRPFDTLKRFFKIYIRDFDGASDLRNKLMQAYSTRQIRDILESQNSVD